MIDEEEYLISYANLKSNLFQNQKIFVTPNYLKNFITICFLVFQFAYQKE